MEKNGVHVILIFINVFMIVPFVTLEIKSEHICIYCYNNKSTATTWE